MHDNHIYTPNGKVTEFKMSLADWQTEGNDPGTTASTWLSEAAAGHLIILGTSIAIFFFLS